MEIEYLERFRELTGTENGFDRWMLGLDRPAMEAQISRETQAMLARPRLVLEYAWAIPNEQALETLAKLSPIVEVGAGGGYWAMLLRGRGVDVVAYDLSPGPRSASEYAETHLPPRRVWSEVLAGDAAIAGEHPERTLFLCWPPYDTPMAHEALTAYLNAGGTTLAYIGEEHGCNANADFFALVDERLEQEQMVAIPRYPGMHDYLTVYRTEVKR